MQNAASVRWNSVMYSHSFLEMYRRVPSPEPCFLMFEAKDRSMCSVYNPASNRWHRIPFTFFHYETKFPCAAAGGLLCFCGVSAYPSLSVCNPLTRRYTPCFTSLTLTVAPQRILEVGKACRCNLRLDHDITCTGEYSL